MLGACAERLSTAELATRFWLSEGTLEFAQAFSSRNRRIRATAQLSQLKEQFRPGGVNHQRLQPAAQM